MKRRSPIFIIVPLVFIAVGLLVAISGFKTIGKAKESINWPTSNGIIVSSEMGQHRDDDGTTYSADIVYEYIVAEETISGGQIKFGTVNTSKPGDARRWLNQYPKGQEVTVYFDPEDPYESVLMPGVHKSTWFLPGFGIVFSSIGAIVLFAGIRRR